MKKFQFPDGTLNISALEELENQVLSVTDQIGKAMDLILQKDFLPMFRCCHSGLLLPGDYVKDWGYKYGIGQGPSPLSEVLDTNYDVAMPYVTMDIRDESQLMHPVTVSGAQVDFIMVPPDQQDKRAVMAIDDPRMMERGKIVRAKQLANPKNRLNVLAMKWKGY